MKRKIAAMILCAVFAVLATCSALAEGTNTNSIRDLLITEQKKPFSFRNGVAWAMNQQQVAAIENIPMKQSASSEWSVLISESPVQVSRFSADLIYMFRQDALRMITYEFTKDCSTLNFQYLTGALCSLYGESNAANPLVVKGWMDRIYQNYYQHRYSSYQSFLYTLLMNSVVSKKSVNALVLHQIHLFALFIYTKHWILL